MVYNPKKKLRQNLTLKTNKKIFTFYTYTDIYTNTYLNILKKQEKEEKMVTKQQPNRSKVSFINLQLSKISEPASNNSVFVPKNNQY